MLIYKIFRTDEWQHLRVNGETQGAPIDLADGFVHFSTATQAAQTAALHFAGVEGLFLAAVETDELGDALKWEKSRGGDDFPHLFAKLKLSNIKWCQPLPLENNIHQFPAGFENAD